MNSTGEHGERNAKLSLCYDTSLHHQSQTSQMFKTNLVWMGFVPVVEPVGIQERERTFRLHTIYLSLSTFPMTENFIKTM